MRKKKGNEKKSNEKKKMQRKKTNEKKTKGKKREKHDLIMFLIDFQRIITKYLHEFDYFI